MLTSLTLAVVLAAGATPTNLDLIEQAVTEACLVLPGTLGAPEGRLVVIQLEGDHQGNWLVEQCATSVLEESGFSVGSTPREQDGGVVIVSIRPMELSMTLADAGRSWLVGPRRIDRTAVCELSSEISDSTGAVLSAVRSGATRTDRIGASALAEVQGSSGQAWLTGGTPTESGGGILEPVVVTGVVASLIYLFYSSRAE